MRLLHYLYEIMATSFLLMLVVMPMLRLCSYYAHIFYGFIETIQLYGIVFSFAALFYLY